MRIWVGDKGFPNIDVPAGAEVIRVEGLRETVVTGSAPGYVFADVGAPSGEVSYRVDGLDMGPFMVGRWAKDSIIAPSLVDIAPFVRDNSRERQFEGDVAVLQAKGARFPFTLGGPVNPVHREPLVGVTSGEDTAVLEYILRTPDVVFIRHDMARCRVPGCLVEPVRAVRVLSASASYVGWSVDGEATRWDLDLVPVRDGWLPPAFTWGDLLDYGTWGDVNSTFSSWDSVISGGEV